VHAAVAEADGRVVGIANYLLHESTGSMQPVCYLQDLFVDPQVRGAGVGKQMIDWLVAKMNAEKWSRLYWNTKENNYRARGLYDKFTPRDPFVRYTIAGEA
jgi:GNAT superfamily N-acetyltransferase